jgi:hypothetical protein
MLPDHLRRHIEVVVRRTRDAAPALDPPHDATTTKGTE